MEYMKGIDGLYIQEEDSRYTWKIVACTEGIRSFCPAFWKKEPEKRNVYPQPAEKADLF